MSRDNSNDMAAVGEERKAAILTSWAYFCTGALDDWEAAGNQL